MLVAVSRFNAYLMGNRGKTLAQTDALQSIVTVQSSIPEDSFTAPMLGTERTGSGVVINDKGLVLTIGYLITEAEGVWLKTPTGKSVQAHALAYDQTTGFGLVQAFGRLDMPPVVFGSSARARPGDDVVFAGAGEAVEARIIAKQEFAGYWEYLLDEAIFTTPAHPNWGGGGLLSDDGRLLGIGSLLLQASGPAGVQDINMVVPIDLLPPILDDVMVHGGIDEAPRPWIGVFCADSDGQVVAMNVDPRGPGADAGLESGDIIRDVRDQAVDSLADFYRKLWASGPAGTEIPLRIVRAGREHWLRVISADRNDFLKKPALQ